MQSTLCANRIILSALDYMASLQPSTYPCFSRFILNPKSFNFLPHGYCWLKKQKDSLAPERQDGVPPGEVVSWTSGLIFGKRRGCQFYRAESRGQSWDSEGNQIENAAFGPPYALIQGILEAQGTPFKKLPVEDCPTLRRGSVARIGSGPEFIISLANHAEWENEYTVFGSVLSEDMHNAEKIATLPTVSDVWNNVNVTVLEKPIPLLLGRVKKSHED